MRSQAKARPAAYRERFAVAFLAPISRHTWWTCPVSADSTPAAIPDVDRLRALVLQTERARAARQARGPLPFVWPLWLVFGVSYLLQAVSNLAGTALALWLAAALLFPLVPAGWGIWIAAFLALCVPAALIGFGYWDSLWPASRSAQWRQTLSSEYRSWQLPPPEYQDARHGTLASVLEAPTALLRLLRLDRLWWLRWTRTPLLRWIVRLGGERPDASEEDKLRWARQWAIARELRPLAALTAVIVAYFTAITALLWRDGLVSGRSGDASWTAVLAEPVLRTEGQRAVRVTATAFVDYLWQIADAIPVLALPDAFGWSRPAGLSSDPTQGILVLLFRMVFSAAIIWYIAHIIRSRTEPLVATLPYAGPVERAVVESYVDLERLPDESWDDDARMVARTRDRLITVGVSPPATSRQWTAGAIAAALAEEQRAPAAAPGEAGEPAGDVVSHRRSVRAPANQRGRQDPRGDRNPSHYPES
jgi:hypothetical protein